MAEQDVSDNSRLKEQDKVVSLFQFIQELNKLKQKPILNYKEYPWSFELSGLPEDTDNIQTYYRDRAGEESVVAATDNDDVLLSVHKPEFQQCPEPDASFKDWLNPGWDDFRQSASKREIVSSMDTDFPAYEALFGTQRGQSRDLDATPIIKNFNDSVERTMAYENWLQRRSVWSERQKTLAQTRNLFAKLYSLYFELQRESETEEIIVANGILCDRDNSAIKHPVLTHRVKLDYDADNNTVFIMDTEASSELYSDIFQGMEGVNHSSLNILNVDLQRNDYHPLDRNDTPAFLKSLIHQLSNQSVFSESGVPVNWSNTERLLLYIEPCYIVRKRLDGTLKAIEQIIENVQETGEISAPLSDIVGGGKIEIPEDTGEESIEEQLAAVGGESVDILLNFPTRKNVATA